MDASDEAEALVDSSTTEAQQDNHNPNIPISIETLIGLTASDNPSLQQNAKRALAQLTKGVLVCGYEATVPREKKKKKKLNDLLFLSKLNNDVLDPRDIAKMTDLQLYWYMPLIAKILESQLVHDEARTDALLAISIRVNKAPILGSLAFWLKQASYGFVDENLTWLVSDGLENVKKVTDCYLSSLVEGETLQIKVPFVDCFSARKVDEIYVDRIFTSASKPALLKMRYQTNHVTRAIYKTGADLREDLLIQVLNYIVNQLWANSSLKLKPYIRQYKVIPTSASAGFVEFVRNSVSIAKFDWSTLKTLKPADIDNFLASSAGSYVSAYVLGIRDRHQDNILIKKDTSTLFHIDFGHNFNRTTRGYDAPRFAIHPDMVTGLGSANWERFKELCGSAFIILRRHSSTIIRFAELLFKDFTSKRIGEIRRWLASDMALMASRTEEDARQKIEMKIETGVSSVRRLFKWRLHEWGQQINGSDTNDAKSNKRTTVRVISHGYSESEVESEDGLTMKSDSKVYIQSEAKGFIQYTTSSSASGKSPRSHKSQKEKNRKSAASEKRERKRKEKKMKKRKLSARDKKKKKRLTSPTPRERSHTTTTTSSLEQTQ